MQRGVELRPRRIANRVDQTIDYAYRGTALAVGQQQCKLVSAQPCGEIRIAQVGTYHVSELAQDRVAGQMRQSIVDLLEAVDVGNDETEAQRASACARAPALQLLRERSAVGQARQFIFQRKAFKAGARLLKVACLLMQRCSLSPQFLQFGTRFVQASALRAEPAVESRFDFDVTFVVVQRELKIGARLVQR